MDSRSAPRETSPSSLAATSAPSSVTPKSRNRNRDRKRKQHGRTPARPLNIWDLHLPVLSVKRREDGSIETEKPIVYGTAFPITPGLFVTAMHVVNDAKADGAPALSVMSGAGSQIRPYPIEEIEITPAIDLALIRCDSLKELRPLPIDFDMTLGILSPVSAVGFPLAMDGEFVTIVPRGFAGHVVTRRGLYQFAGHPPGYEVSFFAPRGLSGAPLVSTAYGPPRCYGYIVQQSTFGTGEHTTPVGIAIDIKVLLSVKPKMLSRPLAEIFGKKPVEPRPPSQRASDRLVQVNIEEGWPGDEPGDDDS